MQGFDVPMWKKILGKKLKGMTNFEFNKYEKVYTLLNTMSDFEYLPCAGGKLDDITVIVSQVVNSHDVSIS